VQQDSGGTHSQTHYLHHPRPRSGIPSPTRFLAPLPSMLHANDAAPTPLGLSLELVVEQASVVEQEYRPAPCLATTNPSTLRRTYRVQESTSFLSNRTSLTDDTVRITAAIALPKSTSVLSPSNRCRKTRRAQITLA
jgi:hypothetical protein